MCLFCFTGVCIGTNVQTAHSFCVLMIKMHSIVLYLLQESWSTQMVQFSQRFMCITQCLTMFPLNSSHYSSPLCKFSSIYAFYQLRDRITSVGLVHNRAPRGMGCQSAFHQCCILCIITTPESQRSPDSIKHFILNWGDICCSIWLYLQESLVFFCLTVECYAIHFSIVSGFL
jgi:hypothetical protein